MKNDTKNIVGACLIGGVIGAALALLYAPKSGSETRNDISRTARRIKKNSADLIEETIDEVNEFASDLKERATNIIEQGMDLSDKAKKEIAVTLQNGQKAIEKQRKRLTEAFGL
jgi:gas vesicle protein